MAEGYKNRNLCFFFLFYGFKKTQLLPLVLLKSFRFVVYLISG